MSPRAWLSLCACSLFLGLLIGWAARAHTTADRYIKSLADRHEATSIYFNTQLDTMIQDNERKYTNGKKKN